ncbi:primase-helicase family protein [Pseudomonas sp. GL-RE-19]|uniref:primase-helicase family protein n=1 Tax=Pseudomonas sp. GL-RE-19 TaxID=2832389 RepID=UPI001CBFA241|nr:primase-helicase family protein [Pseudomonas sp. GL-RE-19]
MSNSTTPGGDIHSLVAQYTAKQNTATPAQAPARQSLTPTATATLSVQPAANDIKSIFGALPAVEFGKGEGLVFQPAQGGVFRPKDAVPFDSLTTPFDKLGDKPWPDPMSRIHLKKVSDEFVMVTAGRSSRVYHIPSGDEMGKEGFRQHCTSHVGEVVLEWKGGALPDPKAKVTPISGVEIVRMEKRAPLGDYWWDHDLPDFGRRVVRRVVMQPNSRAAEQDAKDNPQVFNRWHPLKETMIHPAEGVTLDDPRIAIFLDHLRRQGGYAPDIDETVMFFLAGYAWIYKHPEDKLPWATLMQSDAGNTGKSSLYALFSIVFGDELVASCTGADLAEKFTELTDHKRLVFVHEMPSAANKNRDGYERFKNRVSENKVASRQMNTGSRQILNTTHYFITTNHKDCLPLAAKDRRMLVFVNPGESMTTQQRAEWEAFIDGDGPALVAGLLSNWTHAKGYNHRDGAPQTAGALELQMESRNPLESLLAELMAEGNGVFAKDVGRAKEIAAELGTAHTTATRHMSLDPSAISKALRKVGAIQIGNPTNAGSRALCWRKQAYWADVQPKVFNAYIETNTLPDDYPRDEVPHE